MRTRIWLLALVAALGDFLVGFDTIAINGVEQDIQRLWDLPGPNPYEPAKNAIAHNRFIRARPSGSRSTR